MISNEWKEFCSKGRYSQRDQITSVNKCLSNDGMVLGFYSDLVLNPNLPDTDALYPSHDHTINSSNHSQMVVDARIINDMKSILNETEFWIIIEHLYAVGISKGKIPNRTAQRNDSWKPVRNFAKK
ncbi:MAG: hypothetical protein Q8L88_12270 [Bacteroidota bacterium]|nr:hypothetical protein [Bacteroidota bacterium]